MINKKMSKKKLFIFDGNMGAGKTTISSILVKKITSENMIVSTVFENVEESDGLFEKYQKEPKKYALDFQMWVISNKFTQLLKCWKDSDVIVMDRSFKSDHDVFCKHHIEIGNITNSDYMVYLKQYLSIMDIYDDMCLECDIHQYYIDASPEKCMSRINVRDRGGENINMDFLKVIESLHHEIKSNSTIIDANCNRKEIQKFAGQIKKQFFNYPTFHHLLHLMHPSLVQYQDYPGQLFPLSTL